ncbi:hypothetical protein V8C26DRAFT_276424 [Trichoderma gracile]
MRYVICGMGVAVCTSNAQGKAGKHPYGLLGWCRRGWMVQLSRSCAVLRVASLRLPAYGLMYGWRMVDGGWWTVRILDGLDWAGIGRRMADADADAASRAPGLFARWRIPRAVRSGLEVALAVPCFGSLLDTVDSGFWTSGCWTSKAAAGDSRASRPLLQRARGDAGDGGCDGRWC